MELTVSCRVAFSKQRRLATAHAHKLCKGVPLSNNVGTKWASQAVIGNYFLPMVFSRLVRASTVPTAGLLLACRAPTQLSAGLLVGPVLVKQAAGKTGTNTGNDPAAQHDTDAQQGEHSREPANVLRSVNDPAQGTLAASKQAAEVRLLRTWGLHSRSWREWQHRRACRKTQHVPS